MTRRTTILAGLVTVGLVVLLWGAWRILSAGLSLTTGIAAWVLWLVMAAAFATAAAYLREILDQRAASRNVGWRPVPSIMLLWIAGATTMAVFAFMLPTKTASAEAVAAHPAVPTPSATTGSGLPSPSSTTAAATRAPAASPSSAAKMTAAGTPSPVSTVAVAPAPEPVGAPAPAPSTSSSTPSSSSSTTPLIHITLPRGAPKKK